MTNERWIKGKGLQLRTVRGKTLASLLPAFLVTLLLVSGISYEHAKGIIQEQIQDRMNVQLDEVSGQISANLGKHSKLPEIVARTVEDQWTSYTLEQYRTIMGKTLDTNPDTSGMGIYFEPNRYDAKTKFFSTYAYRSGDKIATTEEYSNPSYNYVEQPWYKNGLNQIEITPPYYDSTIDMTVATVSVPFFAADKTPLGVVTGDLNLKTIQQYVENAQVGSGGWATLYDDSGTYLAGPDAAKVLKVKLAEDDNKELAASAKTLLGTNDGKIVYHADGDTYQVYHQKIAEVGWVLAITVPESELFSPLHSLLLWISAISIAGIAIVTASLLLYSRVITRNLGKVNSLAKSLAEGDFTSHVSIGGRDEFAAMAGHLNQMTGNMRELLENIGDTTLHVAASSEELSMSSEECSKVTENVVMSIQEVASGSEAQMVSTQEAARAMEEMAKGVQRIVNHSLAASQTTEQLSEQAERGSRQMQEAARFLSEMERESAGTVELIASLDQHSAEIGNIAHLISEISRQTNLLALNASIEAARAGEHGKGFAVVAQEVKKLAENSAKSTESIDDLIKAIQQGNAEAAKAMTKNSSQVGAGATLAAEAEQTFDQILQGLASITTQSHEISASSQELMAGTEQINSSVDQLAHIARETAGHAQTVAAASEEQLASMEQVASSSADLSSLMDGLQAQTSRFKVK
ncbi:methyl-accepting chemotaxis protein [Paenibacillus sanguinis]|uniref:methyl-accepting chemotaxis protein n=1 Tax=Paenibacillus sanguinis TaxID=225906 RepID=UPI00037F90E2|nr:methyl-accepting chemotaxis protein [Paenibacillus sanguinis]